MTKFLLSTLLSVFCGVLYAQQIQTINTFYTYSGEKEQPARVQEFDKNGNLLHSQDFRYYILIDNTYDSLNRLLVSDALYAETSALFSYIYTKGKTIEIIYANATFAKNTTFVNEKKMTVSQEFISIDDRRASKEQVDYKYNGKNLLTEKISVIYLYKNTEIDDVLDQASSDTILKSRFLTPIIETTKKKVTYLYSNQGNILEEVQFYNGEIINKVVFEYVKNTKLIARKITYQGILTNYEEYFYDKKNQFITKKIYAYEKGQFKNFGDGFQSSTDSVTFLYDNKGNLLQEKEYRQSECQKITDYKAGKIIQETELIKGELVEKLRYQYVFYDN